MKFNTVILYDIENLIGGYGNPDMLANLSLRQIFDEISKKKIGKIAIQRAYANWSDPRLNILKGDVIELGIDPIQMFGFGKGSQKNASDIQLAIDAIDIAHTKTTVEIFVIVSGDGGFSSLAKKLHEYGKTVIGCAYKKTTNKVFKAVSDDFIWLQEPKNETPMIKQNNATTTQINDPILVAFSKKYKPLQKPSIDEIVNVSKEIISFFVSNSDISTLLKKSGLNISIFSQFLDYRLSGFNYYRLGFTKFTDFIRFAVNNTDCKLAFKEPSEYRLVLKTTQLKGYQDTINIKELSEIHTEENYKQLLAKNTPSFKQFDKEVIEVVASYLLENKMEFQGMVLGDIIDTLSYKLDIEQSDLKSTILSFVSAECFIKEDASKILSEQKLSFVPTSLEKCIMLLVTGMTFKLSTILDEVDDNIVETIIK